MSLSMLKPQNLRLRLHWSLSLLRSSRVTRATNINYSSHGVFSLTHLRDWLTVPPFSLPSPQIVLLSSSIGCLACKMCNISCIPQPWGSTPTRRAWTPDSFVVNNGPPKIIFHRFEPLPTLVNIIFSIPEKNQMSITVEFAFGIHDATSGRLCQGHFWVAYGRLSRYCHDCDGVNSVIFVTFCLSYVCYWHVLHVPTFKASCTSKFGSRTRTILLLDQLGGLLVLSVPWGLRMPGWKKRILVIDIGTYASCSGLSGMIRSPSINVKL